MPSNIPDGPQGSPRISRKLPNVLKSVGEVTLPQYRAQSILDIAGRVVQAESVDEFLDVLLPYPSSRKRALRVPKRPHINASNNPFRTLQKAGNMSEDKVVRLFAAAVKKHNLTPGMGLGCCQYKPDKHKKTRKGKRGKDTPKVDVLRQKVDAAFFREKYLRKDGRPHWSDQGVPVEFKGGKRGVSLDAFEDNLKKDEGAVEQNEPEVEEEQDEDDTEEQDDSGAEEAEVEGLLDGEEPDEDRGSDSGDSDEDESDSDDPEDSDDEDPPKVATPPLEPRATTRKEVRGQLTTYSELLQLIQQRIAVFMLFILGRRFRLLRWDRAGVIVTKSIDYFKEPNSLCEFLWRISHLSDAALGFDPSAIRLFASDPEWAEMTQYAVPLPSDVDSTPGILAPNNRIPLPVPGANQPYFVFDYVRKMFAESLADMRWPRFKLRVHVGEGKTRDFLVGKPVFSAPGAVGRATRGYVAVDCDTGRFVWLKDSWRAAYEGVEQEGLILQRLNAEPQIKDVPTLVCHGDVFGQRTLTAEWWERQNPLPPSSDAPRRDARGGVVAETATPVRLEPARDTTRGPRGVKRGIDDLEELFIKPVDDVSEFRKDSVIRHHKHYRLVVAEVCMPLKKFLTPRQLVGILLDCLCTHGLAATCENLQILHRDITDANVIILPKVVARADGQYVLNWTGILTDWENSKPIAKQPQGRPRQPEHTGNWQFTSVNLLNDPQGVKIPDELESVELLILVYYSIRYSTSSIPSRAAVAAFLDECFDCFTLKNGKLMCGERKHLLIQEGKLACYLPQLGLQCITFNGSPLDFFISESLRRFSAKYKVTKYDDWVWAQKRKKAMAVQVPSPIIRNGVQLIYDIDKHTELDDDPQAAAFEAGLGPAPDLSAPINEGEPETKPPPEPTQEERSLAANVWSHNWMCWMLRRSLNIAGWERVIRTKKDRVPKGWVSSHPIVPCDSSVGHSSSK